MKRSGPASNTLCERCAPATARPASVPRFPPVQLGHMPQEDYPEAVHEMMLPWLRGETDNFDPKMQSQLRMTKKGVVQA